MEVEKIGDFPKNQTNPFMLEATKEIQEHVRRKFVNSSGPDRKAVLNMTDTDTGEVLQTRFVRQMKVDDDKFTKIFLNGFSAFYNLKTAALKVFGYIMTCMRPAKDTILFNMTECQKHTGYKSLQPIYNGLAELCRNEIIARGWADNVWFINPMIAFNGNRVTFINEYVRQEGDKAKAIEVKRINEEQTRLSQETADLESELLTTDGKWVNRETGELIFDEQAELDTAIARGEVTPEN